MKRIIVFRFHKDAEVCRNRIILIKKFNPSIKIYGLFGGKEEDYDGFKKILEKPYLESIYLIPVKDNSWKWKNGDLALVKWYNEIGKYIDFEMLHLIEWDLLIFGPLKKIYNKIPKGGIGLTGLTPLKKIEKDWDWISKEPGKTEWKNLLDYSKNKFGYKKDSFASLGPGTCMPKSFLKKYSKLKIPELVHDELRIPLFGQILGFKLYDTGFYKSWFNKEEHKIFNCLDKEINISKINRELIKKNGRRVFHPYRKKLNLSDGGMAQ